jgi:hypothetical protein
VTLDYSNALDDGDLTLGSGLYNTEPGHGLRVITVSIETFYDAVSEAVRETNFKVGTLADIDLTFLSPSEITSGKPYKFTIAIPNCDITAADVNIGGRDKIKVTITGKALAIGSTSPITIDLWDIEDALYMTALT